MGYLTVRNIILCIFLLFISLYPSSLLGAPDPYMPDKYPPSVWYSTGDLIYVYAGIPMESEATIAASFDIFKKYHKPYRMLWRDAQIEWYDTYCNYRPDSQHSGFMKYWAQHNKQNRATELASKAAKERGIEFWGIFPVLDSSGGPSSAQALQGRGAFYVIDKLRQVHPDFAARDRAGIMSIPGPMEFAYPQVRKEFVRRFSELFGPTGAYRFYDGLQFYTYVENFCSRFHNEYIYSAAVDKEYRKRFGVDPKSGKVDVNKYNGIRGEYFTQLLRDIRPVFKKYGKKLSICLDAADPDIPSRWMCGGPPYILPTGRIKMEWRKWIKEELVDEFTIWQGTPDDYRKTVPLVLKAVQGTPVKLSIHTDDNLPDDLKYVLDQGVRLENEQMSAEAGYAEYRPASDIDSSDDMAVLKVINEAIKGIVPVPSAEKAIALLNHKNPSIRRQAANLIGMCKIEQGIPALESSLLTENEDYVRPMYVANLGRVNGPNSVQAIVAALAKHPGMPMELSSVDAFNSMGPERYADIVAAYDNPSPAVRTVIVHEWLRLEEKQPVDAGTKFFGLLVRAAKSDPVDDIRRMAAASLERFQNEDSCRVLYEMLDDKCHANQAKAAFSMASMLPKVSIELRSKVQNKLLTIFNQYGKKSKRSDKDWGWKPVGYTIASGCGRSGRNEMIKTLNSPNKDLAILAWQVLFTKDDGNWDARSPEQVAQDYQHYPGSPGFVPVELDE